MRAILLVLLLAATPLLAGCATQNATPAATTPTSTSPTAATPAMDACAPAGNWTLRQGTGTVTLLTYSAYGVPKEAFSDFTNLTGYHVDIVTSGDAVEALNKAIITKDAPVADVLFGVDNALIGRAASAGVFAPYASPNLSGIPDKMRTPFCVNDAMLATPLDYGYIELNLDPAWFAAHNVTPPHDLADLATKTYAPLTVVEDPYTSSPGFGFLLATIDRFGDPGYKQFWSDFAKNGGKVETTWDAAYGKDFTQGYDTSGALDHPIVVSYSTSPAYNPMNDYGNSTTLDVDVAKGAWFQVEAAGILTNAKNPDGAKALVDWMAGRAFQETAAFDQVMYPVLSSAKAPGAYATDAPEPTHPASLTGEQIDANRDAWLQGWRDATGMG